MLRSVWDVIASVQRMRWAMAGVASAGSAIFLLPVDLYPMQPAGLQNMSAASAPSPGMP